MGVGPDKDALYGLYADPGTRSAGYVLFEGDRLIAADIAKRPSNAPSGPHESRKWALRLGGEIVKTTHFWLSKTRSGVAGFPALRVVVEYQQIYTHGKQRTKNAKSVLVLTLQTGGIILAAQQILNVTSWDVREPAVWKGNVDVKIQKERTRSQLSAEEIACFDHLGRSKNNDDVWVAAGIGLHDVGRRLA